MYAGTTSQVICSIAESGAWDIPYFAIGRNDTHKKSTMGVAKSARLSAVHIVGASPRGVITFNRASVLYEGTFRGSHPRLLSHFSINFYLFILSTEKVQPLSALML